mmetsp:Transcript_116537/g.206065  ORF Transcript_116537/g.206065 Transcript_116537/m.206065 type:complete len:240 (-) Transcript_116537:190-909(-)
MITFCPVTDVVAIAKLLDDKRLNASRTESGAILKWLRNPERYSRFQTAGFCVMWAYNLEALAVYYNAMLREWLDRGYNVIESRLDESVVGRESEINFPGWWGNPLLHSNHRIALLTKFPEHYGKFGWSEKPAPDGEYTYMWPEWNAEAEDWILRPPKAGQSRPRSVVIANAQRSKKRRREHVAGHPEKRQAVWSFSLRRLSSSSTTIDLDSEDELDDLTEDVPNLESLMDNFGYGVHCK